MSEYKSSSNKRCRKKCKGQLIFDGNSLEGCTRCIKESCLKCGKQAIEFIENEWMCEKCRDKYVSSYSRYFVNEFLQKCAHEDSSEENVDMYYSEKEIFKRSKKYANSQFEAL